MDINAKIRWKSGMSLTSEALSSIEDRMFERRIAVLRASSSGAWGVLPNCKPVCSAMFVKGSIEVKVENCVALLPSGSLLSVDEKASATVGRMEDGLWYFCAAFGEGTDAFEKEGVPYTRPNYTYTIVKKEDIKDMMPLVRLSVGEGNVSMDKDFILPSLALSSDERFAQWMEKIAAEIEKIATHSHLEEGEKKRCFLHQKFLCGAFTTDCSLRDYMRFLHETVMAVGYYLLPEVKLPDNYNVCDPQLYLKECCGYLEQANQFLEGYTPVDDSIDIEALKEQIRSEVYARVSEEISAQTEARIAEMSEKLDSTLRESLREFIEKDFHDALEKQLSESLYEKLNKELYDKLYPALYNALFVPEKEEEIYTPLI